MEGIKSNIAQGYYPPYSKLPTAPKNGVMVEPMYYNAKCRQNINMGIKLPSRLGQIVGICCRDSLV